MMTHSSAVAKGAVSAAATSLRVYGRDAGNSTGILMLYGDAKHAVCSCTLNHINAASMLAAFVLLEEALKYLK